MIVIHCSATKETTDYTFEQLLKDHKARGFNTCGYHYYIRRDGTVHQGRPLEVVGAHAAPYNKNSIGICYEGGLDKRGKAKDTRTDIQKDRILSLILGSLATIAADNQPTKKLKIVGHRDLSPDLDGDGIVEPHEWIKMCPCFDATEEYKGIPEAFNLR